MAQEYLIGDFLKRIKRPITLVPNQDYKLVTIKMNHNGVVLRGLKKGSEIKSNMYEVKSGDFILSGIDARNGAFGIVPEELDGAIVTNDFWYFEIDENIILKELFLELTATTWFDEICKRGSDGTTQRIRLQKNKFFNQNVKLPAIDKQEQLLKILLNIKQKQSFLHDEIENQKQFIMQLKQSILQEAIQGKLTEEWRKENPDIEPASKLLERIKAEKEKLVEEKKIKKEKPLPPIEPDEIPFELPDGWEWCRLGELGITQTGTTPPKNEQTNYGDFIPFIQPSNIAEDGLNFQCLYLSEKGIGKSRFIPKYSNLMVCIGGSAGKTCYSEVDITCNQQINTITGYKGVFYKYLDLCLKSPHFYSSVWTTIKQGSTPILNKGNWSKILVPLCSSVEQKDIVDKVELLMQKILLMENEIQKSEQYAQTLMQAVLKEVFEG